MKGYIFFKDYGKYMCYRVATHLDERTTEKYTDVVESENIDLLDKSIKDHFGGYIVENNEECETHCFRGEVNHYLKYFLNDKLNSIPHRFLDKPEIERFLKIGNR